ncbi:MAG: T9SS type A sorting domain-containing protein, partial [Bacteroidota bacterium]
MLECFSVNGQPALTGDPTSCLLVTSIAKANPSEPYSLFPNPISEKASIRLPANTMQLDLLVTDMSGRIVLWLKDIRNGCMISREGLSKGMYVYRFISSGIPVSTGKLVVN